MDDLNFDELYRSFDAPVVDIDCGERCAPHNPNGVPFCCDSTHAVPSLYALEWSYVRANSDLWREWVGRTPKETERVLNLLPEGQVAGACLGAALCRRSFRSISCRSFPFFPYINRERALIGLAYYWEYEDRCWVISNLARVTPAFCEQLIAAYERLFAAIPAEFETYRQYSITMRRVFSRRRRAIPLLHRSGHAYKISPRTGRMRRVEPADLPAFGPYLAARELPFPDEI